jgi:hypothetical protein
MDARYRMQVAGCKHVTKVLCKLQGVKARKTVHVRDHVHAVIEVDVDGLLSLPPAQHLASCILHPVFCILSLTGAAT